MGKICGRDNNKVIRWNKYHMLKRNKSSWGMNNDMKRVWRYEGWLKEWQRLKKCNIIGNYVSSNIMRVTMINFLKPMITNKDKLERLTQDFIKTRRNLMDKTHRTKDTTRNQVQKGIKKHGRLGDLVPKDRKWHVIYKIAHC